MNNRNSNSVNIVFVNRIIAQVPMWFINISNWMTCLNTRVAIELFDYRFQFSSIKESKHYRETITIRLQMMRSNL